MKRIAVFAAPSLPPQDRVDADNVSYLGSARRGDVERAAGDYDVVLLIDGLFREELTPSPKEALNACRRSTLIGAASVGALRAVECAPYGARTCGVIARWYASGYVDGDDEVALAVHPHTQRALSVPLVNVRHLLYLGRRRMLLTADEARGVLDAARAVFYAERTWDDVLDAVPSVKRAPLRRLAESHGDLKRLDARFALRCALRLAQRS